MEIIENNEDEPDDPFMEKFYKLNLIGEGGFGKVYLVKHKETEKLYAMKVINKNEHGRKALIEHRVLAIANHPFITKLYYCYQDEQNMYLVMQYCEGGDLFKVKENIGGFFTEKETKFYASCILLALEYLHFNGIVYRDLKLENILMTKDGHIMLTDFDMVIFSKKVVHKVIKKGCVCTNLDVKNSERCGTVEYMSPEIVEGKIYDSAIDWWSFGILIFEMLYGKTPFKGGHLKHTMLLISTGELTFPKHKKISKKAKNLIKHLLAHEVKDRLGYREGSTEIKAHPFFKSVDFRLLNNQDAPIIPNWIVNWDVSNSL